MRARFCQQFQPSRSLRKVHYPIIGSSVAGLFITFEGSEACGKSTQVDRLRQRLLAKNYRVIVVYEPGFTEIGLAIRHLLLHAKESHRMTPETELLLFAASRAQLVREIIQPALAGGSIVLSDRFYDSTTVYQGLARGLDVQFIQCLNRFAADKLEPNLTFVLDLDPAVAASRRLLRSEGKSDRIEELPEAFFSRVRQGYLDLAAKEPGRVKLVDAGPAAGQVEEIIWKQLDGLLS